MRSPRLAIAGLALAALGSLAALAGWVWLERTAALELRLAEPLTFDVGRGETFTGVLADLGARGVVPAPRRVRWWSRLGGHGARIHAGEYRLEPGASVGRLAAKLERGDVFERRVTLIEGWRFEQVRAALGAAPRLVQASAGLSDEEIMARLGHPDEHPEGRFFPDTYRYTAGTSDLALLRRAYERMAATLEREWAKREVGLPYDDPEDALILASLVEKETGVAAERDMVAAVFVRRLERGMRLQTDPSVIYGLGDAFDGDLRRADLANPHPWNTYVHRGLPPTPIAMPGLASIRAALHPADTDALYFVARGDGTSVFSATLEAHREAVRRFQSGDGGGR